MEQQNPGNGRSSADARGGSANTPDFPGTRSAVSTAADHQIPADTDEQQGGMRASGAGTTDTEREIARTRDLVAEAAAPVMAEKAQEAISETADRLTHDPRLKEQAKRTAEAVQHDAQRMAKEKLGEVRGRAEEKINRGMRSAAEGLDTAAGRIDRMADTRLSGGGARAKAGELAHAAADTMESVASYLRDQDARGLQTDLERQVRERPLQTLFIGVAAGWIVGKILR